MEISDHLLWILSIIEWLFVWHLFLCWEYNFWMSSFGKFMFEFTFECLDIFVHYSGFNMKWTIVIRLQCETQMWKRFHERLLVFFPLLFSHFVLFTNMENGDKHPSQYCNSFCVIMSKMCRAYSIMLYSIE